MKFSGNTLLTAILVFTAGITADWCVLNSCRKKRAVPFGALELDAPEVLQRRQTADVEKRQGGGYTYSLTTLPPWAALPYSKCGGSTICPNSWYCQCQNGASSRCLPTTLASGPCSVYAGATAYAQCEFYWPTTDTVHATAFGQCGGYTTANINQAWDTRTVCPEGQHCACSNFWYSQCTSTNLPTTCPGASIYWGCGGQAYTSPKASGDYCGGHCFTVSGMPSACPGGMKCYTETGPSPGFAAICASSSPPAGPDNKSYQPDAKSLCYPVPYTWTGFGAPVCGGAKRDLLANARPYHMTKPSRVPANSPAEATPPTLFSHEYAEATTGQTIEL
ncbi:hypothetical protein TWF694_011777 [Orbilia ellipsospora]|uniref:CBM1 domain-containing protein n=1 Tax=Orbilia ellipsospora TaxID=2528407 RepID=A0AAV9X7G1_9PEZI